MNLFTLLEPDECDARTLFEGLKYPWEALPKLAAFITEFSGTFFGSQKNVLSKSKKKYGSPTAPSSVNTVLFTLLLMSAVFCPPTAS